MPNPVFTYILDIRFVNITWSNSSISKHLIQHKSTKLYSSEYSNVSLTIQLNISHEFTQLNDQTVLFPTIQFSISHLFVFTFNVKQFYLIHRQNPVRCYYSCQSGPGSNGNEGVLHIPQSSCITGASLLDCLVSYPEYLLEWGLTSQQRWSQCILQPQPTGL